MSEAEKSTQEAGKATRTYVKIIKLTLLSISTSNVHQIIFVEKCPHTQLIVRMTMNNAAQFK